MKKEESEGEEEAAESDLTPEAEDVKPKKKVGHSVEDLSDPLTRSGCV